MARHFTTQGRSPNQGRADGYTLEAVHGGLYGCPVFGVHYGKRFRVSRGFLLIDAHLLARVGSQPVLHLYRVEFGEQKMPSPTDIHRNERLEIKTSSGASNLACGVYVQQSLTCHLDALGKSLKI